MDLASGDSDRSETRTRLLEATRQALCKHGYADLTMQAIADESTKSKACLHYHYDTKAELLSALFDHLLGQFLDQVAIEQYDDPDEQLRRLVDANPPGRSALWRAPHPWTEKEGSRPLV
jgi:AcrR family transcriptional regulator